MKYEFDLEKIGKAIDDICRYLEDLKETGISKEEDLFDKNKFYATSMTAFSIINRCIDLGNEIISACNFGIPTSYRDIFEILYRKKVINEEIKDKFLMLIYHRNLIAHEYHRITEKELFTMICNIPIVENFLEQIKKFVKNDSKL